MEYLGVVCLIEDDFNLEGRIKSRQAELNSFFQRIRPPQAEQNSFLRRIRLHRAEQNLKAWRDQNLILYRIQSDPPKVMIDIDKISKALWKAGYKNMSSIIEKQLTSIVPFNEHELDRIILYKNNSITIFAPPDEALGMENSMDLRYQVAISKVQKEDFDTSDGYDVRTLYNYGRSLLMIRLVPERGYPSVNGEQITKWNIYNDGRVLVHGVEDYF
ncbi:hypothetical protein GH714_028668 [Hevea brasiliensis]|uniref:Uncharacterized protein n=1 Tax=Hevea brasiliensis TaxID=3981 RepID=A0A6A6M4A7_HEVBR|nr:hypothetical protein GH714_028668 [Hevea brasiliensis]